MLFYGCMPDVNHIIRIEGISISISIKWFCNVIFAKVSAELLNCGFVLSHLSFKVPIPVTPDLDPLTMLTDDADIAAWQNEGLPADRMSTENATILSSCQRWPLMVDPQLQGIKWIKKKYGEELKVIRIGQKG